MKHRHLISMALFYVMHEMQHNEKVKELTNKEVLKGTRYENVNIGESPIFIPSRSQKIKSKIRNARCRR